MKDMDITETAAVKEPGTANTELVTGWKPEKRNKRSNHHANQKPAGRG